MRVELTLAISGTDRVLPINYQYEFSAWIYKMIHFGDSEFAVWLHEQGYTSGNKSFKLFTFSNLEVERFKVFKDRFKIVSDEAKLILTFHIDEAAQHFVTGLFQNNTFTIGDRKSQVDFEVKSVEALQQPDFPEGNERMRFSSLSPICVTKPVEVNGSLRAEYLSPKHPEYERRFFENLVTRYKTVHPEVNGQFDNIDNFHFKAISKPKSRLIKIKAGTPQQTKVRGFLYDFVCVASVKLLRFGYEAGFAEKNALGFGCVEIKK